VRESRDSRRRGARWYNGAMKASLVRFGVAIEAPLLAEFDTLVEARGCSRSELLRDLARAEVARDKIRSGVDAVATLTIVYDHHVRDLSERLTDLQHELGERVRATLHVHLSHDLCLEVIVMRGKSNELKAISDRIIATRGVSHGGVEIIAGVPDAPDHDHGHGQGHAHPHGDAHGRAEAKPRRTKRRPGKRAA
jgi:CopG family nickel-responsive transcriptional regulator